jgi:hypothetical protein
MPALHWYGAHSTGWFALQWPALSQVGGGVFVLLVQVVGPHVVDDCGKAQLRVVKPLQEPPQTVPSDSHVGRLPTGWPVTGEQVPSLFGMLHAAH